MQGKSGPVCRAEIEIQRERGAYLEIQEQDSRKNESLRAEVSGAGAQR